MAHNWQAVPHHQMYEDIHNGPGAGGASPVLDSYEQASAAMAAVGRQLIESMERATQAWHGPAAEWAASALTVLHSWSNKMNTALEKTTAAVANEIAAFEYARGSMPEPVAPRPQWSPWIADFAELIRQEEEAYARHIEAARVMSAYEQMSNANTLSLPEFEPLPPMFSRPSRQPDAIGHAGDSAITNSTPGTMSERPPINQPGQPGTTEVTPPGTPPVPPGFPVSPPQGGGGTDLSHVTPVQPVSGPTPLSPGAVDQVRTPAGYGPVGYFQGGGNPAGRGPGGGVVGRGVTAAEGFAGRSTGSARGGGTAMAGVPGSGARKAQDEEHKRKYVVDDDQDFLDDHLVAPPVIGEGQR